jgi:hypothetical protein
MLYMLSFFLGIILFLIFASFLKLNSKNHTIVDEHGHKIIVILMFFMVIQHAISAIVALQ